jgi:hypothetical protein
LYTELNVFVLPFERRLPVIVMFDSGATVKDLGLWLAVAGRPDA